MSDVSDDSRKKAMKNKKKKKEAKPRRGTRANPGKTALCYTIFLIKDTNENFPGGMWYFPRIKSNKNHIEQTLK